MFPHAWRFRDYVIDSLNEDKPFDRFLREQIAGDLLTPATTEGIIATGFLALGSKPAKAMNNNFAMDVVADQIDVIGTGIMGISVACARCHDHKFDPVPTRDYYALAGIFNAARRLRQQREDEIRQILREDPTRGVRILNIHYLRDDESAVEALAMGVGCSDA